MKSLGPDKLFLIEETSCGEGWMRVTPEYFTKLAKVQGVPEDQALLVESMGRDDLEKLFPEINKMWIEQDYDKAITRIRARVVQDEVAKKYIVIFAENQLYSGKLIPAIVDNWNDFIFKSLLPDCFKEENEGWVIEYPQLEALAIKLT